MKGRDNATGEAKPLLGRALFYSYKLQFTNLQLCEHIISMKESNEVENLTSQQQTKITKMKTFQLMFAMNEDSIRDSIFDDVPGEYFQVEDKEAQAEGYESREYRLMNCTRAEIRDLFEQISFFEDYDPELEAAFQVTEEDFASAINKFFIRDDQEQEYAPGAYIRILPDDVPRPKTEDELYNFIWGK